MQTLYLLQIPRIDLYDDAEFSFMAVLDPNHVMPTGAINIETVVPAQVTYETVNRTDRLASGYSFFTNISVVEFGFNGGRYTQQAHNVDSTQ